MSGIADRLGAERFTKAKVGHGESNVFGDGGGEVAAASKSLRVDLRVGNGMWGIVILNGQRSGGEAIGDERNADRRTFPEQVRATRIGASAGVDMDASAAKRPTLFGGEDLVGGADAPFGDGLDPVPGGAAQCDATRSAGKQTAQTLRNEAKDFFPGGAGLEQASEFADLRDFVSLAAGIGEQASDFLVGGGQLVLRGLALSDFLMLVELGQSQPESEGDERGSDGYIGENSSVRLFPLVPSAKRCRRAWPPEPDWCRGS